jgi:hypothetical protein
MIDALTPRDVQIVRDCMHAVVKGPFIPDWEFSILFGIGRTEVAAVLKRWPAVDFTDEVVRLAVLNSLVQLLGYPIEHASEWPVYIHASQDEVKRVLEKLT